MVAYAIRRVVQAILALLLLTLLTFFLLQLLPGGPVVGILGHQRVSALAKHQFIVQNGYDKPIVVQYLDYLRRLAHGNLGFSYKANQSVNSLFANDLPKSLILVGSATLFALLLGIGTGLFQAIRAKRIEDHLITGGTFFIYAMPDFFLAQIVVEVLAIHLHWFPVEGPQGPTWTSCFTEWRSMVLPVATLTGLSLAGFSRYVRSSALDVFGQEFIRTARAKGASGSRVLWAHTLRNSLGPIVTLVGLSLPGLFAGAFIIEDVFNYPGIGLLTLNATYNQDYPIILGTTILLGFLTIIGNLLADLGYAWLDPRVRVT